VLPSGRSGTKSTLSPEPPLWTSSPRPGDGW
jgi:hypothetical protein